MSFTSTHLAIAKALASGIVPTNESPGAGDLPVAEMIFFVAAGWSPAKQAQLSGALDLINRLSITLYNQESPQLDTETLNTFVAVIANSAELHSFWRPFRIMVVLNFYGLPEGYKPIGLPGPSIDKGGFNADGEPA